ncbi:MAG: UDP-N-acetylmuramoyl-L-alanyl-D-glutamate--2,6-diaminopimelate ligase [candidate division Zixibacteria bacterium]|nr:UDP-N-acetylmuramoyl-L-alanyl-D-glutamate--2,6-diaminopimelate ligase [candidate division Zixibacteria bacterium]
MHYLKPKTAALLFEDTGAQLPEGADRIQVTAVEYDSRKIKPGSLFFAIPGYKQNGTEFIGDAVSKGAVMVATERFVECDVPMVLCAPIRKVLAEVSAAFYEYPSRSLRVIGVTGTNGKTTVCSMIKAIFDVSGQRTAQLGTLGNIIGDTVEETLNTTPESRELQRLMRKALDSGSDALVLEVSSHSLVMYRTHAVDFDLGVFTNLSSEHLDFHKEMEDYFDSKGILFEQLRDAKKPAVINISDEYGRKLTEMEGLDVISFGHEDHADVFLSDYSLTPESSMITVKTPRGDLEATVNIPGKLNIDNALATVAVGIAFGISFEAIKKGLFSFKAPKGRMQRLDYCQPFQIYIDYAHTPKALDRLLGACKEFTRKRLITLFGCGGDRDRSKRVPMAEAVARYSDLAILTSDNPRTEDPEKILDEVEAGFPEGFEYIRESSREKAIHLALRKAEPGDTLIIAGKGHEEYQIYGNSKQYFSEAEIIEKYLKSGSKEDGSNVC